MANTSQRLEGGSLRLCPEVCPILSGSWLNDDSFDEDNKSDLCGDHGCPGWGDQLIWAQTYEEALYWSRSKYAIKTSSSCVDVSG